MITICFSNLPLLRLGTGQNSDVAPLSIWNSYHCWSSFFKYGIIIKPKYVTRFLKIFLEEPGGTELAFYTKITNLDLNSEALSNISLFKYNIFGKYKIHPHLKKYLEKHNPILHFLDTWDRQEIVIKDQSIHQKLLERIRTWTITSKTSDTSQ